MTRRIASTAVSASIVLLLELAGHRTALPAESPVATSPEVKAAVETAKSAADALTSELMKTLVEEMGAGGPTRAVRVCGQIAPAIAAKHSTETVKVRRVTLKARNPGNAPDAFEREHLEALQKSGVKRDTATDIVAEWSGEGHKELRLMRPIFISGPCLACHGSPQQLDVAVADLIQEKYPGDRAVGYKVGDLRGAVSVRVKLEPRAAERP